MNEKLIKICKQLVRLLHRHLRREQQLVEELRFMNNHLQQQKQRQLAQQNELINQKQKLYSLKATVQEQNMLIMKLTQKLQSLTDEVRNYEDDLSVQQIKLQKLREEKDKLQFKESSYEEEFPTKLLSIQQIILNSKFKHLYPQHPDQLLNVEQFLIKLFASLAPDDVGASLSTPNLKELTHRLQNFNIKKSIISKLNSSKFFSSPSTKVSFLIQYVCVLEMYFSDPFLSSVREQLLMSEHILINKITEHELNPSLYQSSTAESSVVNSSFGKMYISSQYQVHTFNRGQQLKEKIKLNQTLNEEDLEDVKEKELSETVIRLMQENKAIKKSLNQMMKNEEAISELNNTIYFKELEEGEGEKKDCVIF